MKDDFASTNLKEDSLLAKIRSMFKAKMEPDEQKKSTIPRGIVRSFWLKDRATNEKGEPLYPTWRHIITAGGVVVHDAPNPYWDGSLPYDMLTWGFNVDSAYGRNEVQTLEMPQLMLNKVLATIIENAMFMANGIWIGDYNALDPAGWKKLSNEPGGQVKVRPGTKLERVGGPPLPLYTFQLLNMLGGSIEKLSGVPEASQGRRPGQVTSGAAIESLQVAGQTLVRLKSRQVESLISRVGQKMISRIFEYYTTNKIFSITRDSGVLQKFEFERHKILDIFVKNKVDSKEAFKEFVFKVAPGSSLAMTKWQKGLIATQLYQLGIIDDKEVLDAIEWPNRDEVIERTRAAKAAGIIPQGGPRKPVKMARSVLRGGHKETGMQLPQTKG
jgi:hypothetical protein